MNVVILSDTGIVNGGAAKVALDGAQSMARAGHRVELVCGAGEPGPELKNIPGLTTHRINDFDVLEDPNRLRAFANGWWNPRSYRYVADLLDSLERENTVVHVHSWTKALSSSAIRAAWERGFEIVATLHDYLLACPTGTRFLQDKLEKCHLRPMSLECIGTNCDMRSYPQKLWRVGRHLIQDQFGGIPSRVRNFIVISRLAQELLRPHLPADAVFHFVPNAIDVDPYDPAPVDEHEEFLFLGRITPEKGAVLFAKAAAAESVRCRFIGDGMARAAVLEANPHAKLEGWMNHSDGLRALRQARALVFPSLWYETLGLVVLEAAANGVPSIVPDECAARESVEDGVTGLYFRSGDEADLRRKLAILKDPETAARMGRAAYERFWAPPGHSVDLHRSRLEAAYTRILSPHHEPLNKHMTVPANAL